jgi:hypothetical protein
MTRMTRTTCRTTRRPRGLFVALVATALTAGLLTACGSEGEGGGLNESDRPLPTVPVVTRISPEELAKQSAESAGYSMKASAVEDPAQATSEYQAQPDTRLFAVQVELENVSSSDPLPVDVANAIVTDDAGVTYNAVAGARDGEIAAGELKQGEKSSGWIAFTVPTDVNPKSITYRVGIISTVALEAELPAK